MRRCGRRDVVGGSRKPSAAFLVFAAALWSFAPIEEGRQTASAQSPSAVEPLAPPVSLEDLQVLRAELAAEAQSLRAATRPAETAPQTRPGAADAIRVAGELLASVENLLQQIDEHIALRSNIATLNSEKAVADFTQELAQIQKAASNLERSVRTPPWQVTQDELRRVVADLQAREQELNSRLEAQAARNKSLASLPQEKQGAAAAAQAAQIRFRQESEELSGPLAAARTEEEKTLLRRRLRRAQLDASVALFRAAAISLREQRDNLVQSREERRLGLLRTLVDRLTEWKDAVLRVYLRGEREAIQYELEYIRKNPGTVPVYERTYWEILALQADARDALLRRTPPVFSVSSLESLRQRVAGEKNDWNLFMSGLEYRPREQARAWYQQSQEAKAKWEAESRRRREQLNQATEEHRQALLIMDSYEERIRAKRDEFNEQINRHAEAHPGDAAAEQKREELVEARRRYLERTDQRKADLSALRSRLEEAARLVESLVEEIEKHRSRLYWYQLYAADRPLWSPGFARIAEEWTDEAARLRHAREIQAFRQAAGRLTTAQWFAVVAILGLALAAGAWVRTRANRYALALSESLASTREGEDGEAAPLSDRFHLLAARLAGRSALIAVPAAALAAAALYGLEPPLVKPVVSVLLLAGLLSLSESLVRVAFAAGKPRLRLLRCSNRVATHYRRWFLAVWFATLLLAPAWVFLWSLGWMGPTTDFLAAAYKAVSLGIVLLFGLRRQLVLRVAGRPEQMMHPGVFMVLATVYPLLWCGVAVLFVLTVAGYGPLTGYVVGGVLKTLATLVAGLLVARYVTDLSTRWQSRLVAAAEHAPAALPATGTPSEASVADAPPAEEAADAAWDADSARLTVAMVTRAVRWATAVAVFFLVMRYWNITAVELKSFLAYEIGGDAAAGRHGLVVGRVLAAAGVLLAAWWVSRELRRILLERIYPVYTHIDRGARTAINTILHYSAVCLGVYFALYALNVPLGAVTVVLGTIGLGVGLGLQPLMVNFISGLLILFERHIRVGDVVEVDGKLGEVTAIRMRSTEVTTYDNIEVVIPNSDFITQRVINWTLQETRVRGRVNVGVSYRSDPELVRNLLLDIARRHPNVLREPAPMVWLTEFGPSSLDFALVLWFGDVAKRGQFLNEIRFEIMKVFKAHGIEIPFPQVSLSTAGGEALPVRLLRDGAEHATD